MKKTISTVIEAYVRLYGEDMRDDITVIASDAEREAREKGEDPVEWAERELLDRL